MSGAGAARSCWLRWRALSGSRRLVRRLPSFVLSVGHRSPLRRNRGIRNSSVFNPRHHFPVFAITLLFFTNHIEPSLYAIQREPEFTPFIGVSQHIFLCSRDHKSTFTIDVQIHFSPYSLVLASISHEGVVLPEVRYIHLPVSWPVLNTMIPLLHSSPRGFRTHFSCPPRMVERIVDSFQFFPAYLF